MTDPPSLTTKASDQPSPRSPTEPGPKFSGQQRALVQALEQKEPALATMYRGGLAVLADGFNPDRFSLCAHAMRELMEKLPEYLDVSTKAQQESLKAKVREVENLFLAMRPKTMCFTKPDCWDGHIDGPLRKFLVCLVKFFDWVAAHHPRRRDEIHGALTRLDRSELALPAPLASLNVDAWDSMRSHFQLIAHHRKAGDQEEFMGWLDALERFLLDRMVPRTFEDFAEIDALLVEDDSHA